jgi:hypothetical protein
MSTAQQPPPPQPQPPPAYAGVPTGPGQGPIGEQRKPWKVVVLTFVTFGVYGVYWAYRGHEDVKVHTGEGVGGVVGALIYLFAGIITIFLLPLEIKKMYERDGRESPVSARTAAWILLFAIPWYVKVQRALNDYWGNKGAAPPQ